MVDMLLQPVSSPNYIPSTRNTLYKITNRLKVNGKKKMQYANTKGEKAGLSVKQINRIDFGLRRISR